MRALEEAGIPIDVVGGTSIGAIAGYLHCRGFSYNDQAALVEEALLRTRPLEFPTLPIMSLSAGRRLKRMLTDPRFSTDGDIEDLRIPFFCISTNLTRARVVVHDRGEIYPALRASVSLPGVFPPVWKNGDLLVDGGVMNNLPVDVMRNRLGGGVVIASDVHLDRDLSVPHAFDVSLRGTSALLRQIAPRRRSRLPSILSILTRTVELGDRRALESQLAAGAVDLNLRPPLDGFGRLDP
jgi:predicted acylesterase/phospholipase RssA